MIMKSGKRMPIQSSSRWPSHKDTPMAASIWNARPVYRQSRLYGLFFLDEGSVMSGISMFVCRAAGCWRIRRVHVAAAVEFYRRLHFKMRRVYIAFDRCIAFQEQQIVYFNDPRHLAQDVSALAYEVAGDLSFRTYHDLRFGGYQAVHLPVYADVSFTYNISLDGCAVSDEINVGRRHDALAFAFLVLVKHR